MRNDKTPNLHDFRGHWGAWVVHGSIDCRIGACTHRVQCRVGLVTYYRDQKFKMQAQRGQGFMPRKDEFQRVAAWFQYENCYITMLSAGGSRCSSLAAYVVLICFPVALLEIVCPRPVPETPKPRTPQAQKTLEGFLGPVVA